MSGKINYAINVKTGERLGYLLPPLEALRNAYEYGRGNNQTWKYAPVADYGIKVDLGKKTATLGQWTIKAREVHELIIPAPRYRLTGFGKYTGKLETGKESKTPPTAEQVEAWKTNHYTVSVERSDAPEHLPRDWGLWLIA